MNHFVFSCCFCDKVFFYNSLPASSKFCRLLLMFANSFDPGMTDRILGLIMIQTVLHSDSVPEIIF